MYFSRWNQLIDFDSTSYRSFFLPFTLALTLSFSFATRVPLLKADLCQHFTIVFFLFTFFHFEWSTRKWFNWMFFIIIAFHIFFSLLNAVQLSIDFCCVSFFRIGFYDVLEYAMPANRTRSNHTMCFTWMNSAFCDSFDTIFFFALLSMKFVAGLFEPANSSWLLKAVNCVGYNIFHTHNRAQITIRVVIVINRVSAALNP